MLTFYKRYYRTAFDIALLVVTVYLFMLAFSYLYRIATPIFLAFVIYAAIEPLAAFLHRKGMKKSIASAISALVFVLVIIGALTGAGIVFAAQVSYLAERIPIYAEVLQREIFAYAEWLQTRVDALPPDVIENLKDYSAYLAKLGGTLGSNFLKWLVTAVSNVSSFLVNFVIGIILAYFLSIEIDYWRKFAREKVPRTFKTAFAFLRENVLKDIVTYLKAQAKLVTITFVIIYIALLVLRVENAFSVAVLSAVFDILPLLGVATVFVPWIVYLLITGKTTLAVALGVLLAIVILVRQILEPKITGDSLGVSGFTMLSFVIVSMSLFGVAGLILSPVLIILLKALYDQGYLQKWIHLPKDEFDEPPGPRGTPT